MRTPRVQVGLEPKIRYWLQKLAAEHGISESAAAAQMIESFYYGRNLETTTERIDQVMNKIEELTQTIGDASGEIGSETKKNTSLHAPVSPAETRAFMYEMHLLFGCLIRDEKLKSDITAKARHRFGDAVMAGR